METLIKFLHAVYPMSKELEEHLRSILKYKTIRKREFLLKPGRICENVYFIENGLFRCFYIKEDGEVCNWFMREGDVMFAVKSFYSQTPSYEAIQALEDCDVYYITYRELQHIYRHFIEFNVHRGMLTEKYYLLSEDRSFSMRYNRSFDRYKFFKENYSDLISRLSSKDIASYIGVSRATMTRLRSNKG